MKKFLYAQSSLFKVAIVALLIFSLLSACATTQREVEKKAPVLPPVRVGSSTASASFEHEPSLENLLQMSDLVAYVKVGDWLGENSYLTFFLADVKNVIKGPSHDKIILYQDGSGEFTPKDYPLFTAGNEMFLFLREVQSVEKEMENYAYPRYVIFCGPPSVIDVCSSDNGDMYGLDRYGCVTETMNRHGISGVSIHYAD